MPRSFPATSKMNIFGIVLEYILTNHRDIFATVFLLPISTLFDSFLYLRLYISLYFYSDPARHDERVKRVQRQVLEWRTEGSKVQMCTSRPGWQTMSMRVGKYKKTNKNIQLNLHDVISIDEKKRTLRVEPMCNMGQITAALNPKGWTLAVTPELDDLTIGGLISGFGIESSSHKYGLFQYTCKSFEVVMADGSVKTLTPEDELFHLIPWSHGTLGFLVSVELQIIPATKYVKLRYIPARSRKRMIELFERESRVMDNDFVECLAYSNESGVIMTGKMTNRIKDSSKYNPIGRWYKPWFYKHVEGYLAPGCTGGEEYIPLRHYYHRHTKSIFWIAPEIISWGNHPLFRWLLGWMPLKINVLKITETETTRRLYEENMIAQDMLVPMTKLGESLKCFDEEFDLYPLWICPMRVIEGKHPGLLHPFKKDNGEIDEMFVDIGGYGRPTVRPYKPIQALRNVEAFVRSVDGYQALYADTHMTREEFREMFDHKAYDAMREKLPLCKEAFPEIYDKISAAARTSLR